MDTRPNCDPAQVVMPAQLHERYTLHLNADGTPVQRSLSEMTAEEVLLAILWHAEEADRLAREVAPFREAAIAAQAGGGDPGMSYEALMAGTEALQRSGKAFRTRARLLEQVLAILQPHGHQHPDMPFLSILRRYWPGVMTEHPHRAGVNLQLHGQ